MNYYNAIQEKVDKFAQKKKYFCADFLGVYNNCLAFIPCKRNTLNIESANTELIVAEGDALSLVSGEEALSIFDQLLRREHRRGEDILAEYKRKCGDRDFYSEKEKNYIYDIVGSISEDTYDTPFDRSLLVQYLEIADRFGMKIVFKP